MVAVSAGVATPPVPAAPLPAKVQNGSENVKQYFALQSKQLAVQREVLALLTSVVDDASAKQAAGPLQARSVAWQKASIAANQWALFKLTQEEGSLVMELLNEDPALRELSKGYNAIFDHVVRLASSPQRPNLYRALVDLRDGPMSEVDWARGSKQFDVDEKLGERGSTLLPEEAGEDPQSASVAEDPKAHLRGISTAVDAYLDASIAADKSEEEFFDLLYRARKEEGDAKLAAEQLPAVTRRMLQSAKDVARLKTAIPQDDSELMGHRALANLGVKKSGNRPLRRLHGSIEEELVAVAKGPYRAIVHDALTQTRDLLLAEGLPEPLRSEFVKKLGDVGQPLPE